MKRRDSLRMARMGVCAATAGKIWAAEGAVRKPNVLFILPDDMRPDCIGALGNRQSSPVCLGAECHWGFVMLRRLRGRLFCHRPGCLGSRTSERLGR